MNKIIRMLVVFLVVAGLVLPAFAEDPKGNAVEAKKEKDKGKKEVVTKTGMIEFDAEAKGDNRDSVFLKIGSETFKLLTGKKTEVLEELKKLNGKETTVRGPLLPSDERNPLPAIRVNRFQEGKELKDDKKPLGEILSKTGILEVKPAPVFLVVDGEEVRVVPGAGGKEMVEKLAGMHGKKMVLKGEFLPKKGEKKPAVLRLESFEEQK